MKVKSCICENTENIMSILFSIIVSLVFLFCSPIHPWIVGKAYTDSSVFMTVALMMERGYMPYRDTFDHKGPFIYILNYIGNKLHYYWGVWIVEVLFLSVTVFFMYKIARLLCGKVSSIVSTLMAFSLLFDYFEGGNLTEEYAMPCIASALYIFLDYLLNEKLSKLRIIFAGIGLGIVLMLRPNMIAVWFVFCISIFIHNIFLKKNRDLCRMIIYFAFGLMLVLLPIFIWLILNKDFSFFWKAYIEFNKAYSFADGRANFSAKMHTFLWFLKTTICIMSYSLLLIYLKKKELRYLNITYLVYMVMNIVLISLAGIEYGHYGMIIVPATVYPISLLFNCIENIETNDIRINVLSVVSVSFLISLVIPQWLEIITDIPVIYENRKEKTIDSNEEISNIMACINQYTTPDQAISVYGNYDIIYVLSNRKHATRYSYQSSLGQVVPEILDEYFSELYSELPNVIVVQKDWHDERMTRFLDDNNYSLLWSQDSENLQSVSVYSR
ncbi:ArnT family glycosyltransferase [Butyrivibrio sp. LB2008]|uniref:ArnT family glycosyltransferase n=1 Tax=Butyrivibrio sp. LB2008 TaxID=1408305 RepID=UPI00047D87A0|nr:glycosyltransferase family 39 protein [Butyrivibrio sp. LB2008]